MSIKANIYMRNEILSGISDTATEVEIRTVHLLNKGTNQALEFNLLGGCWFTNQSIAFQVQNTIFEVLLEGIGEGDFCGA